ncbi:hypothetical protein FF38_14504 [Lucilia cuprina]|uniref:Uncharacterized protein n=1 Tax=Lucilia cuprina TaxID=7375 RepID=A0A0L0CA73_LUCCU|nr:hypothetical protein FF38_14504 [Lucilia cuprina]
MLLAYADDIDIIGRNTRADHGSKGQRGQNKIPKFEVVKDFIYLEAAINSDYDVSLEIKPNN